LLQKKKLKISISSASIFFVSKNSASKIKFFGLLNLLAGVHMSPWFGFCGAGVHVAGVQGAGVMVVVSPGIENSTGRSVVDLGMASMGKRLDLPPNG